MSISDFSILCKLKILMWALPTRHKIFCPTSGDALISILTESKQLPGDHIYYE